MAAVGRGLPPKAAIAWVGRREDANFFRVVAVVVVVVTAGLKLEPKPGLKPWVGVAGEDDSAHRLDTVGGGGNGSDASRRK